MMTMWPRPTSLMDKGHAERSFSLLSLPRRSQCIFHFSEVRIWAIILFWMWAIFGAKKKKRWQAGLCSLR